MSKHATTNREELLAISSVNAPISRRSVMRALFAAAAAGVLFGLPQQAGAAQATKETTDALAAAQAQFDQVQSQLDDLSNQYASLSEEQDKTIGKIEDVQTKIDEAQKQIDAKQAELEQKQEQLSLRVSDTYKGGTGDGLALVLSSTSFEELINNVYYANKINARDREAIQEVRQIQDELKTQKADLETQKADLEKLKAKQASQLEQMKAKQEEVSDLLNGLSDEVKQLMAKRDEELLASAKAEEAAAAAAEAAKKAQQQPSGGGSSSGGASSVTPGTGQQSAGANAQQRVVNSCHAVPSPGYGLCAAWVSYVFSNAGLGAVWGNACDMYNSWCTSSNKSALKVGMIIAVSTHSRTSAGRIYGHVGIYVGNNTVMDNIGYIRSINVDSWISYFGTTVTPRWGWANGLVLG